MVLEMVHAKDLNIGVFFAANALQWVKAHSVTKGNRMIIEAVKNPIEWWMTGCE